MPPKTTSVGDLGVSFFDDQGVFKAMSQEELDSQREAIADPRNPQPVIFADGSHFYAGQLVFNQKARTGNLGRYVFRVDDAPYANPTLAALLTRWPQDTVSFDMADTGFNFAFLARTRNVQEQLARRQDAARIAHLEQRLAEALRAANHDQDAARIGLLEQRLADATRDHGAMEAVIREGRDQVAQLQGQLAAVQAQQAQARVAQQATTAPLQVQFPPEFLRAMAGNTPAKTELPLDATVNAAVWIDFLRDHSPELLFALISAKYPRLSDDQFKRDAVDQLHSAIRVLSSVGESYDLRDAQQALDMFIFAMGAKTYAQFMQMRQKHAARLPGANGIVALVQSTTVKNRNNRRNGQQQQRNARCFLCNQTGHMKNQCPTKKSD